MDIVEVTIEMVLTHPDNETPKQALATVSKFVEELGTELARENRIVSNIKMTAVGKKKD